MAKTTWFGIPDFSSAEEEWVGCSIKDHEVRNGNDMWVGFRLVEESVPGIRSPFSNGVCQFGGVGWLAQGRTMIIKVSVVTIDDVRWEQNVRMLV